LSFICEYYKLISIGMCTIQVIIREIGNKFYFLQWLKPLKTFWFTVESRALQSYHFLKRILILPEVPTKGTVLQDLKALKGKVGPTFCSEIILWNCPFKNGWIIAELDARSRTTGRGTSGAWASSTTSTRTESSSTTSPATTGSQSSARPKDDHIVICEA
jgi:hypothetical protein